MCSVCSGHTVLLVFEFLDVESAWPPIEGTVDLVVHLSVCEEVHGSSRKGKPALGKETTNCRPQGYIYIFVGVKNTDRRKVSGTFIPRRHTTHI